MVTELDYLKFSYRYKQIKNKAVFEVVMLYEWKARKTLQLGLYNWRNPISQSRKMANLSCPTIKTFTLSEKVLTLLVL